MDKLQELYDIQEKFTNYFLWETHDTDIGQLQDPLCAEKKLNISKEYILSIIKESTDLLDGMNWKMHTKKNSDELDNRENFLEDAIDVLKYTLGLLVLNGYTLPEIEHKFKTKSRVVQIKYDQNLTIKTLKENLKVNPNKKIAVIDIDGVLNKYPKRLLEYAEELTGIKYKSIIDFKQKNYKEYKRVKNLYRGSGEKQNTYPSEEASNFIYELRQKNYFVILLTSRPYNKYYNIFNDTTEWLKQNYIGYDLIVWEENKAEYIIENLPSITFAIDDDIDICNLYESHGIKTYHKLNKKLYNSILDMNEDLFNRLNNNIKVIYSLSDIKL